MKKLIILLVTIVFNIISLSLKCQLTGYAFLSGQTNHSGITAKFIAQGGTAVTDSTTTTPTGSYSINIVGGVYKVSFSKAGYITSNYNNGATTLLTNTVVLANDTLLPGNQVFVSGNVSGNWINTNTYIVNGNIIIPTGDTLTIQPGTNIRFNGNYSVLDTGVLIAIGTASNPIIFTSNYSPQNIGNWNHIEPDNSNSIIDHCIIEYAQYGFSFNNYNPIISNNVIRNIANYAIYSDGGSPHIFNNTIYNCINTTNNSAVGIWVAGGYSTSLIECNTIYNCTSSTYHAYGMIVGINNYVRNNIIHDISGAGSWGISNNEGNTQISNNYIYNCETGIDISTASSYNPPNPTITNNVLYNNTTGITIGGFGGSDATPTIINNIITNNHTGVYQASTSDTIKNISYNVVWNNSTANYQNVAVIGIGQIVGTNSQGNSIDSYYNMSQNPLFASSTPPALSSLSPCLNAGDTVYSHNIGFDTSYICPSVVNPSGITSYTKNMGYISLYPNPTNSMLNLSISQFDNLKMQDVEVTNVLGEVVYHSQIATSSNYQIDVSTLPAGIYFVRLGGNTQKFIKQ